MVVGLVSAALLVSGCSSSSPSDAPAPSSLAATTVAAPTSVGSAEDRAKALAAVPAALTRVTPAQRQAACSSYTAGKDAFLSSFESRFDAKFTAITPDELSTVRSTLDTVCGG